MIVDWWRKLKSNSKQLRGASLLMCSILVLIFALRYMGGLQLFEWTMFDSWFRLRPLEAPDRRITIVTINEADIAAIEKWPLPDAVLAQAITNLKQKQPRAIGLDIYRDLPVEPGHQDLLEVFASTPNLIGIEKVVGNVASFGVAPPPILAQKKQVAAADLVVDRDGKLRRSLLSLKDKNGETVLGLGTKLALLYLEPENIYPQIIDSQQRTLRLGKGIYSPLRSNDGGYLNLDLGGYQILANFRRSSLVFQTLSFSQVLANDIPRNLVRDRLILIGLKAESFQDRFYNPYSTSLGTTLAGVEVHADLASQIIATALDGEKVFRFWSETAEWLWIILWSGIGTALAWVLPNPKWILGSTLIALSVLVISTYFLFLWGYWVIVVSPILALLGSAASQTCYVLWMNLRQSHRQIAHYAQTLEYKVAMRTQELEREISHRRLAQAELQTSLTEKELLLKEVYHRVKNNLQVISSLFSLHSQYVDDPKIVSILAESQNRVQSIASVHQQLTQSEQLDCVNFPKYLESLIAHLFNFYQISHQRIDLDLQLNDVCLDLDRAILCGLIANELISNCLKHAFPSSQRGSIAVNLSTTSSQWLYLVIKDNGIGLTPEFDIQQTNSLGLRLVKALTRQLKGTLDVKCDRGVRWQIVFPQSNI